LGHGQERERAWERAEVGKLTGVGHRRWRGFRAVAKGLLGRLEQTAAQKSFGFARNGWRSGSSACSGVLDGKSEKRKEVVWEGEWSGVSEITGSGSPFIGWRGERGWCPAAASSRLGPARE
jgi:hypothetical protein